MNDNQTLARSAEEAVANALMKKGLKILERNYRRRGTELDLIACKEEQLFIIEVKFRNYFEATCSSLVGYRTKSKSRGLIRGAQSYITHSNQQWTSIRFDLVVVAFQRHPRPYKLYYYPNFLGN